MTMMICNSYDVNVVACHGCAHKIPHREGTACNSYCHMRNISAHCIPVATVKKNPQVETLIQEAFSELQNSVSNDKEITEAMIKLEVNRKLKKAFEEAKEYLNQRSIKVKREKKVIYSYALE